MVVVIKITGDINSDENLKIIAGYMINMESGYEFYDSRGNFKKTKKKFNEYVYKNVNFDIRSTMGKILIIGPDLISHDRFKRVLDSMESPHILNQYFPETHLTGQHILLESKYGGNQDNKTSFDTNAFRTIKNSM